MLISDFAQAAMPWILIALFVAFSCAFRNGDAQ